ncbi:hypothetical protein HYW42_04995 [Candidatus Daviesbacteria bacterium]|nr:hypothetical protein [Candidatus Daviesbacteria bacterium]
MTLVGLFIMASLFFYFSTGISIKNLLIGSNSTPLKKVQKPTPPSEYHGWVAWWDETNALDSLSENSGAFKSVSPVWYKINEQGTLEETPHKQGEQIKIVANKQTNKLIPTITNEFDSRRTSLVLNNSDKSQDLIESLKTLVLNSNYLGVDIDWEEINPKDQQAFTAFIKNLSEVMHQNNLTLTVSVHPQTGKFTDRAIARGYNLKALSESADAVKIMAYDFHNQNSNPGAITPLSELTKVLKYTVSIVPTEKVILGLPTYGYDWEIGSGKAADAVSFTESLERVNKNNGQTTRDMESFSLVGSYTVDGKKHLIWFEDAQTISKMIEKARVTGIYQFSFWRIGVEDPGLWAKLLKKV